MRISVALLLHLGFWSKCLVLSCGQIPPTTMASFSHLPVELVEQIVSYLSQHDKSSFCRLNGYFHTLATPLLYRHVDLFIPPSNKLPKIDHFCLNIIKDSRKANNVESIRLGLSAGEDIIQGQRWLPQDNRFDDQLMLQEAKDALSNQALVPAIDYLRHAFELREYSAYAALALLILPSLQRLDVSDYKFATVHHLQIMLRNLEPGTLWKGRAASQALIHRLSSIKRLSLLFDRKTGMAYPRSNDLLVPDHFLNIPSIEMLELSISGGTQHQAGGGRRTYPPLVERVRPTDITTLVFRHSGAYTPSLLPFLECTPKLRSLTYEFFFDCNGGTDQLGYLVDLASWSDTLRTVASTLEILVLSIEYCDTSAYFFQQPRIKDRICGYLDMTYLSQLHTLEVPIPFLTGDTEFSIGTEICPLFPPNLRNLVLRSDLSHAQHPFPLDVSILPNGLTFEQSKLEAQHLMNARMDVSYMYQASLTLLEIPTTLESISVWQPADPSLAWFDSQIEDFASTCRNKNITGRILTPMLLRWKKAMHWDLLEENTVFDKEHSEQRHVKRFCREEREGRPIGLASQYHLHALRTHQVKIRR